MKGLEQRWDEQTKGVGPPPEAGLNKTCKELGSGTNTPGGMAAMDRYVRANKSFTDHLRYGWYEQRTGGRYKIPWCVHENQYNEQQSGREGKGGVLKKIREYEDKGCPDPLSEETLEAATRPAPTPGSGTTPRTGASSRCSATSFRLDGYSKVLAGSGRGARSLGGQLAPALP